MSTCQRTPAIRRHRPAAHAPCFSRSTTRLKQGRLSRGHHRHLAPTCRAAYGHCSGLHAALGSSPPPIDRRRGRPLGPVGEMPPRPLPAPTGGWRISEPRRRPGGAGDVHAAPAVTGARQAPGASPCRTAGRSRRMPRPTAALAGLEMSPEGSALQGGGAYESAYETPRARVDALRQVGARNSPHQDG